MNKAEFQLRAVGDPRLAAHAASPFPAWLWSIDGASVRWANAAGARVFGAPNPASLVMNSFGPADSHRRQVAQLLSKVKDPKVQSLLASLLDDTDAEVQTEAVRLIGELK